MPNVIRFNTTIPAATTVENITPGSMLIAPFDAQIRVAATNVTANAIALQVFTGGDLAMQESFPGVERIVGKGPILPEDILLEDGVLKGDSIIITARNSDLAVARIVTIYLEFIPV